MENRVRMNLLWQIILIKIFSSSGGKICSVTAFFQECLTFQENTVKMDTMKSDDGVFKDFLFQQRENIIGCKCFLVQRLSDVPARAVCLKIGKIELVRDTVSVR